MTGYFGWDAGDQIHPPRFLALHLSPSRGVFSSPDCVIQSLSFVCPLKSVSLGIEYCKYLLGREAGMPSCVGMAGTWIPFPALIKAWFGRLKCLQFVGVVQAAFLVMKGWISRNRRWSGHDFLCHRWVLTCVHPPVSILVLRVRFDGTWEHLFRLLKHRIQ